MQRRNLIVVVFRDHYRDSITEYPNEYKDNHDGYDNMPHPNQHHHQPGKSFPPPPFVKFPLNFSPLSLQSPSKLSFREHSHLKCWQQYNPFASLRNILRIRIEIMR